MFASVDCTDISTRVRPLKALNYSFSSAVAQTQTINSSVFEPLRKTPATAVVWSDLPRRPRLFMRLDPVTLSSGLCRGHRARFSTKDRPLWLSLRLMDACSGMTREKTSRQESRFFKNFIIIARNRCCGKTKLQVVRWETSGSHVMFRTTLCFDNSAGAVVFSSTRRNNTADTHRDEFSRIPCDFFTLENLCSFSSGLFCSNFTAVDSNCCRTSGFSAVLFLF